jgi:hypothetical protein
MSKRSSNPGKKGVTTTIPAMRRLFELAILLAASAGISLYLLTESTEQFFAWTIASPLTAAFLGALYLGDIPLLLAARREKVWAYARATAWGILFFTGFSLVATLLHLDKFHLSDQPASSLAAGWYWMAVYISLPLLSIWLIWRQAQEPGHDPKTALPMSGNLRLAYQVMAVLALLLGINLLFTPASALWPWALTPLTSRAISARILAFAGVAWLAARSGDRRAIAASHGSLALRGALVLGAFARFPAEMDPGSAGGMLFLALAAVALLAGGAGLMAARRAAG